MPTIIAFDLDYTLIWYGVMRIQHPSHKPDPNNPHEELILHLMPGTIEALKQIYSKNHKFILITARDPDEFFIVRRIIWEIERLSGVHFESLHFTSGTPKGAWAKQNGATILIDDCRLYLSDCQVHGVIPVLFTGWPETLKKLQEHLKDT